MSPVIDLIEPSSQTKPPAGSDRGAAVFVWGIWALMRLGALVFISKYAGHVPFWDDWNLVPARTGNQRLTAAWLWEPINEHRIPLPKLLLIALYKLTYYDFRA